MEMNSNWNNIRDSDMKLTPGHVKTYYCICLHSFPATKAFINRVTPRKQLVTVGTKNHALRAKLKPLLSFALQHGGSSHLNTEISSGYLLPLDVFPIAN